MRMERLNLYQFTISNKSNENIMKLYFISLLIAVAFVFASINGSKLPPGYTVSTDGFKLPSGFKLPPGLKIPPGFELDVSVDIVPITSPKPSPKKH